MILKNSLIRILFFSAPFICLFCSTDEINSKSNLRMIEPDKYIFVEYNKTINGKIIEGFYPPGKSIDAPSYLFQADSGKVIVFQNHGIDNKSFKILLGISLTLTGSAGNGKHSELVSIDSLPFSKDSLLLQNIKHDGTVTLTFRKKMYQLEPDHEYSYSSSKLDSIILGNQTGKILFTTEERIINHGILEKSKIINK